jgi:hypothetical protein
MVDELPGASGWLKRLRDASGNRQYHIFMSVIDSTIFTTLEF